MSAISQVDVAEVEVQEGLWTAIRGVLRERTAMVGLAILVALFRGRQTVNLDEATLLKR